MYARPRISRSVVGGAADEPIAGSDAARTTSEGGAAIRGERAIGASSFEGTRVKLERTSMS